MPKVNYSIIIPHKNIPNLLQRCLNSIPRREDVQIIIVDDNSDPNKVDFKGFPGLNEPCVEIFFTKEGYGAGYARNVGLEHAKGKWVLFADADDFFMPVIKDVLNDYIDTNFDIVYFSVTSLDSNTLEEANRDWVRNEQIQYCKKNKTNNLLRYRSYSTWSKLISLSLVLDNRILFSQTEVANDALFSIKTGHLAKKVLVSEIKLYCITYRPGSLDNTLDPSASLCRIQEGIRINDYLLSINRINYAYNPLISILLLRKYDWRLFVQNIFNYLCRTKLNIIVNNIKTPFWKKVKRRFSFMA